jgi:hypothetical protein
MPINDHPKYAEWYASRDKLAVSVAREKAAEAGDQSVGPVEQARMEKDRAQQEHQQVATTLD